MSDEVYNDETITRDTENVKLRRHVDSRGFKHIITGQYTIDTDVDEQLARLARWVLSMPARFDSIAWIGGGMCQGPRLVRGRVRAQDVYEKRPAMERFCPSGATFILGDWRDTINGQYDVIVYDVWDPREADVLSEPDRTRLESHLTEGGLLLGGE